MFVVFFLNPASMLRMKELRENLQNTVGKRGAGEELDIILMHSALDAWHLR